MAEYSKMNLDFVDPEMVEVIHALNQLPFLATVDSCYGHPGTTANFFHHHNAFIGVKVKDGREEEFMKFFRDIFYQYPNVKVKGVAFIGEYEVIPYCTKDLAFRIVLSTDLNNQLTHPHRDKIYNVEIVPMHNPNVDLNEADQEKQHGLQFLCKMVNEFIYQQNVVRIYG